MSKLLLIPTTLLFLPGLAFAAFDDVSLTTSARLTVNGITLNVTGSTASVESITVGSENFTVVLLNGSNFRVEAPNLNQLTADTIKGRSYATCNAGESSLGYTPLNQTVTVTITPSTSLCSAATAESVSSGGGGGGGAIATVNPVAVAATTATKEAQIATIMQAIAALQAQMQQLTGAPAAQVSAVSGKITANLSAGSRGASVKALQQFLNTHGFVIASSGPGSPGQESEIFGRLTEEAVKKFQRQYRIVTSGTPGTTGYGYVGPKTRTKINELSGN